VVILGPKHEVYNRVSSQDYCVITHNVRMPHVVKGLVLAFDFMYTSAYIFIRYNDTAFALNAYQASPKPLSSEK